MVGQLLKFFFIFALITLPPTMAVGFEQPLLIPSIWSQQEGAPANRINSMIQGSDGFLWLATYEGLVRFDGRSYKLINHQNHPSLVGGVLRVLEGRPGSYWLATTSGSLVRIEMGKFSVWTINDGIPPDTIDQMVASPDGNVVFLGPNGFLTIDANDRVIPLPTQGLPSGPFVTYAFSPQGTFMAAPQSGGLWLMPKGASARFIDPSKFGIAFSRINAIYPRTDGSVWLGMELGVAWMPPGHDDMSFFVNREFGLQDRNLRLSDANDLTPLGGNTLASMHFFTPDGLFPLRLGELGDINETVNSVVHLKSGGYALATYSRGVILLTPSHFPFFNRQHGLNGILVNAIHPLNDKEYLIAHNEGVSLFDGTTFRALEIEGEPFTHYTVDVFVDSRQRIWIGTIGQGLFLHDGQSWQILRRGIGFSTNTIRCFAEDSSGTVWIGTREGLYSWQEGLRAPLKRADGLRSEYILSLFVDPTDRIWVGTARGGLHTVVNGRIDDAIFDEQDRKFDSRTIFAIHQDQAGTIWGGMTGGIFIYQPKDLRFVNLYEQLDMDSVFHVIPDHLESLWLSSSRGLFRIARDDLLTGIETGERLDRKGRIFNRADGLPTDSIRPVSRMHIGADARLWFPTENGFSIIDPETIHSSVPAPSPFIDRVYVNDNPVTPNWFFQEQSATLAPGLRRISFHFTLPDFSRGDQRIFRFRLVGFDDDWNETTAFSADYTNLPPGEYLFEVQAANRDRVWSTESASFHFQLTPFFRQTNSFIAILIMAFLALTALVYKWRTYLLHERQAKLEQLVELRTAEIRANEQQLAAQNQMLQKLNHEKNEFLAIAAHDLKNPLAGIESLATLLAEDMTITPVPEDWQEYTENIIDSTKRMSALITNLLDINRIEQGQTIVHRESVLVLEILHQLIENNASIAQKKHIIISCDMEPLSDLALDTDLGITLQILDNLLSNAIKFSPPNAVVTIVTHALPDPLQPDFVRFDIIDHGPGIDPTEADQLFAKFSRLSTRPTAGEVSTGLGLSIAKQLTQILHGEIGFQSRSPNGACFWLKLPIRPPKSPSTPNPQS